MAAREWIELLSETTFATSAAILLVLCLRWPIRRLAGWRVTYGLWAIVPAALVAVLLPAPVRWVEVGVDIAAGPAIAATTPTQTATPFDWTTLLLAAWLAGALRVAWTTVQRQRRFTRALGPLRPRGDGLWQAESTAGLPAVMGLRPKIVLPKDFDMRYDVQERSLILAHERQHARRGDLLANALGAALRCVYWFNPLLLLALARFRRDQELACDASVLAQHSGSRRAYGQVMLKTELAAFPAPLACQWFGHHPLKERIIMLRAPIPTRRRWMAGSVAVLLLGSATAVAAWAAQPAQVKPVPDKTEAQKQVDTMPELKDKKMDLHAVDKPAKDIAAQVARENGLRFDGVIPDAQRPITMRFVNVSVRSVLQILGAETKSTPIVENGVLRFVPAPRESASGGMVDVRMKIQAGGTTTTLRIGTRPGREFSIRKGASDTPAPEDLILKGTATPEANGQIRVALVISKGAKTLGTPEVLVRDGIPATITVGGGTPAGSAPDRSAPDRSALDSGALDSGVYSVVIDASTDPKRYADVKDMIGSSSTR